MSKTRSPLAESYLPDFQLSEPVFSIVVDSYWGCLRLAHDERYKAPLPSCDNNAITNLAISMFSEHFNEAALSFTYDKASLVSRIVDEAKRQLQNFYLDKSTLKKPKISATYQWLANANSNDTDVNDDLIRVFRYLLENEANSTIQPNVLALINILRDKYDKK